MPGPQRDIRVKEVADLDAVDRQIIAILSRDGRTTNADLAASLGVAPSTAHTRMRSLVDRGIITGFHASVDHQRLGRGLQAMIGVALRPGARFDEIDAISRNTFRRAGYPNVELGAGLVRNIISPYWGRIQAEMRAVAVVQHVKDVVAMFQRAFARWPDVSEVNRWQQATRYLAQLHGVAEADILGSQTVWQEIAHAIFNTKEFIYIE